MYSGQEGQQVRLNMNNMILTDETDIYTYFEIIEKAEAKSILDIGMFLKRIGSVSRQVKDKEIPVGKILDGVDCFSSIQCPVWTKIYDKIYSIDELFDSDSNETYELATVLHVQECMSNEIFVAMWKWLCSHVSYILTDVSIDSVGKMIKYDTELPIDVDGKKYWFITV